MPTGIYEHKKGYKHSEEARKNISLSHIGKHYGGRHKRTIEQCKTGLLDKIATILSKVEEGVLLEHEASYKIMEIVQLYKKVNKLED